MVQCLRRSAPFGGTKCGLIYIIVMKMVRRKNNAESTTGGGVAENGSLATPINSAFEKSICS